MFSRLALLVVSAIALLTAAAPGGPSGQCNTGSIQCCQSYHEPTSSDVASRLVHAGLEARDSTGMVGLNCGPGGIISVGGGTSCSSAPMCCSNNTFGGLVAIGCTPIGVGI